MLANKPSAKSIYQENREKARQLRDSGMSIWEISQVFGRPYQTVYCWVRDIRPGNGIQSETTGIGHNADRHLCRTCRYRGRSGVNGCDYVFLMGHGRGCKLEECDKYVKGRRIEKREVRLTLNGGKHM